LEGRAEKIFLPRYGGILYIKRIDRVDFMTLKDELELSVTREKLAELQEQYEATRKETGGNQYARELTLRSLKKLINQLTEEIARYKSHVV
jgi:hypothetical protein